jgi:hypothetical protein
MLGITLGVAQVTAQAKPAPGPTAMRIEGKDLANKIVLDQKANRALFQRMLVEVNWLATATPQASAPAAKALGPKYTVTVLVKDQPQQMYDLYPLATGGPRAHRAAKQPGGKRVVDGWFYGRQTMSESLRLSGAPIKAKLDVVSGGIGGGAGEAVDLAKLDPVAGVNDFISEMRRLMLLNGAVLTVILFGLAGMAYLVRRRV